MHMTNFMNVSFPSEQDFGGTSGAFESNVKQLHDWLSTMEMSRVAIGDADDMDRASQRQTVSLLLTFIHFGFGRRNENRYTS